ncbi:MAG: hypothetical protein ACI8UO_000930 [Verrucomicrobiales bacterium]|jgi:hypothetical protein
MKRLISLISLASIAALTFAQAQDGPPTPDTSCIRVNVTNQGHNFIRPWEKSPPVKRNGLGAVLAGNRVLVTAELIVNHTYIELEQADTGEKTPAKIVGVDYEVNLALLAPVNEDSKILDGYRPLELANDVRVGDNLEVWQLEDNGTPATTNGEVIKVSIGRYFVDGSYFLTNVLRGSLQYRAGSFTLPVAKNGKLVGLLLSYDQAQQTSNVIAPEIIAHFIDDLDDGEYGGFPNLGISYAQTLDEQLRKYQKIEKFEGGVFVRRAAKDGSAADAGIETGDVILEMNGYPIDSRGNYDHPDYGKLNFSHLVRGDAEVGDVLPVKLVRDGKVMSVDLKLLRKPPETYLVDPYMFDRGPRFLIFGGVIFQELTLPYLKAWGDQWATRAPFRLVHAHAHQDVYEDEGREKLVILSAVIRTPTTLGYEQLNNLILTQVNGREINTIRDLKEALNHPTDGIHKIEFNEFPKVIYVDDKDGQAVNAMFGPKLGIMELERLE